ncbi:MAG: HU family DNA-binding protein [Proteobacteria bacterium]|nr:HU family DNA-binding protein [Pseudomonadota bacterium]
MTKGDLIDAIASSANLTKAQAGVALNAVLDGVTASLKKGDAVTLIGFGTFKISERKAREGRNPRTGETIKIAAKKSVSFSAGKSLKDTVNSK